MTELCILLEYGLTSANTELFTKSNWVWISARHCSVDDSTSVLGSTLAEHNKPSSSPNIIDDVVATVVGDVGNIKSSIDVAIFDKFCCVNDWISADGLNDWNKLVSIAIGQLSGRNAGTDIGTEADAARSSLRSLSIGVFDWLASGDGVDAPSDELYNL